jgi:mannose-1-phosphate guanylyltransferase
MKAMLLAAGEGVRLRPLSLQRAKPAIRFLERPLLCRTLRQLAAAGVEEAVVNLHHLPETVRRAVQSDRPPLRVVFTEEPEILGTGGGLRNAAGRFLGEDAFLLVNGDCVYDVEIEAAVAFHRGHGGAATMVLMENPDPTAFSAVEVDGEGCVRRIAGLPEGEAPEGTRPLHFLGIHVLGPAALDAIPPGVSDINRDVYPPLIEAGVPVRAFETSGFWHDLGTPARYLAACRAELERRGGGPWVAPTAEVCEGAAVDAASVLGDGARVEEGAHVEGSVLLDGARAGRGARVRGCVLGYGTWLPDGAEIEGKVLAELPGGVREEALP